MIATALTRADVLSRVAAAQAEIFSLGVRRLALFGSVQRNAARPDSDVDVLVEFQPGQKTYRHFFALGELLEQLLDRRVELVTPESLSPFLQRRILAEATDVIRAA
jgi:predicted nucleotidyltransferase